MISKCPACAIQAVTGGVEAPDQLKQPVDFALSTARQDNAFSLDDDAMGAQSPHGYPRRPGR